MTQSQDITLHTAIQQFLNKLASKGKHARTLYTYGKDCEQILAHFGPDKKLANILPAHIARFLKSDELLKLPKTGQYRAPATIAKTQRVFCILLTWAVEEDYLSSLPWPKRSVNTNAPSSSSNENSSVPETA